MLFSLQNVSILVIILIIVSCALFIYTLLLAKRLKAFLLGSNGASLESAIVSDRAKVESLVSENKELRARLSTAEKKMSQSIRSVQTVRFNPFADQGSNQSFATALVDETGSGVVISSLYARERVSIFAKPINDFQSTYELTVEEKQSLEQTKSNQYGK
jgi:biopolymer transport protein ExbB/TolQ